MCFDDLTPSQVPPRCAAAILAATLQVSDSGPLSFSIHLQSGHTLLVDLYLCYDMDQQRSDQGHTEEAASATPSTASETAAAALDAAVGWNPASNGNVNGTAAVAKSEAEYTSWCAG